jgi:hypothetical protein
MGAAGSGRVAKARAAASVAAAVLVAALVASGCGSEDFPNEPRAPAPIEVTAKVDDRQVVVSPDEFGAGLVNFTVTNLADSTARFVVSDADGTQAATTGDLGPGTVTTLKVAMDEGNYEASGGGHSDAKSAAIDVGEPRAPATNELLEP